MAIKLYEPKWYKYWCHGLKIYFNTHFKCEDERLNSIKRTHKGYIIPDDANLGVEPSTLWNIIHIVSIIVRLILLIWILIYSFSFGCEIFSLTIVAIILIRFLPMMSCSRNFLYDIIF